MKIGIIGAGNMGTAFATRLARAGHDVAVTSRNPSHAEKAAAAAGGKARAVRPDEVARDADLLVLATPYAGAADALRSAGDVRGKTVVDISNPVTPDMSDLSLGHSTSAAEEIQRATPGAKVVKAFNTIFAQVLGAEGSGPVKAQDFYAGDDAAAKDAVRGLIESASFEPVDAGPLANARHLEPVGMLNIYFGYVAGRGTAVAPTWIKVA